MGLVSDHVLINRASKERALHQVIKHSFVFYCLAYLTFNYSHLLCNDSNRLKIIARNCFTKGSKSNS